MARARGGLPGWLNDAVFALPTAACVETAALCRSRGWQVVDLGPNPARLPDVLESVSDMATIEAMRRGIGRDAASERAFAAILPGGRVLGQACSAIAPGGVVLTDVSPHAGEPPQLHRALASHLVAPRPRRLPGRSALLGAIGHNNFYHWMLDVLPRIGLVRDAGVGGIERWIVAESRLPVARELLARCGIDREAIVGLGRFGHVECDELVVTNAPGRICEATPRSAAFLRTALGGGGGGSRRVYVARRGRRKVSNEHELHPVLEAHGFEIVAMEGRSLDEQCAAFRGAALVVAPHGAALAHLVQLAPGGTLVELMPPGYANPSFFMLAGACGLRYGAILGESVEGRGGVTERDYRIEAQQLDRALRAVELHA